MTRTSEFVYSLFYRTVKQPDNVIEIRSFTPTSPSGVASVELSNQPNRVNAFEISTNEPNILTSIYDPQNQIKLTVLNVKKRPTSLVVEGNLHPVVTECHGNYTQKGVPSKECLCSVWVCFCLRLKFLN